MSQSGYTPIQLYRTTTAAAAPTSGNLAAGELAINLTDEKLYFKNAAGTVKTLASSGASTVGGSNTQVQFNSSGTLAGSANFVFDGTNVGIGATPVTWFGNSRVLQIGSGGALEGRSNLPNLVQLSANAYVDAAGVTKYINTAAASSYLQYLGAHTWNTAASGTAGATVSFTQAMVIDANANITMGTSGAFSIPGTKLSITNPAASNTYVSIYGGTGSTNGGILLGGNNAENFANVFWNTSSNLLQIAATPVSSAIKFDTAGSERMRIDGSGNVGIGTTSPPQLLAVGNTTDQFGAGVSGAVTTAYFGSPSSGSGGIKRIAYDRSTGSMNFIGGTVASSSTQMALTVDGYLEAVYSDEVVALGNSGTATSIDLRQGNVFTATLTGNCTFTLTNPNANTNRGSSFTLILTNDATAGRTVAWAGGAFRFPGGAATLSRTTTANAVDIWVFFTPNNGTTWYGNISMKNMIA
jgi:hypothetical protein